MSHHLTIAKATLAASLLRPDVTKISRDDLPHFHQVLEAAVLRCTPSNVQTCKQWLLEHVLPSTQRTTAFARYLNSLARYLPKPTPQTGPSLSRQRLHLAYILNDIFHHAKHHALPPQAVTQDILSSFHSILPDLFRTTASEQKKNTCRRLEHILSLWQNEEYFPETLSTQIGAAISDPPTNTGPLSADKISASAVTKELPYTMPSTHGDPSLPFYELPAGNLMPHILPNSKTSMRPESIRPLQFVPGPPDVGLVNAVRDFLKDIERLDDPHQSEDESIVADIDDLGQIFRRNEVGEMVGITYYGWSRAFCEKMQSRHQSRTNGSRGGSGSPSNNSSRSQTPSPHRKRRYTRSDSDSPRSRSRSSHSFSENRDRNGPKRRMRSRTRSPSRFLPSADVSTSRSMSSDANQFRPSPYQPLSNPYPASGTFSPPPPLVPGRIPIPPPRPANWPVGSPWPPPPPPPPPASMVTASNGYLPPLPPQYGQYSHQGGFAGSAHSYRH